LPYWDWLKERYLNARSNGEEAGVASTLSMIATKAQFDDLVGFVLDPERGSRRVLFIGPIARLGGPAGQKIVESLRDDPILGPEATEVLRKLGGNRAKRYAKARTQLAEAVSARPEPALAPDAVEWSTSFDLPDWKRFTAFLRKALAGELAGPLGKALFAAVAAAPVDDEEHVPVNTRLGVARVGWFIDDPGAVDAYIFGSPQVHDLCDAWHDTHIEG
jgi:hypothetical protein